MNKNIKIINDKFSEPFGKPENPKNMILSKNCRVSMIRPHTGLNNNTLVIGGPGSGKTYNVALPNLLQTYGSYVVIDPTGKIMDASEKLFDEKGYDIKKFNLKDLKESDKYDPFSYIRNKDDMLTFVKCLLTKKENDPFWIKAETCLLEALVTYLIKFSRTDDQKISSLFKMFEGAYEDPEMVINRFDKMFAEVEKSDPDNACSKSYKYFKYSSEKTANRIIKDMAEKFSSFNNDAIKDLTSSDDIKIEDLYKRPTVVFIVGNDKDNPYNFLVNVLLSQMLCILYDYKNPDAKNESECNIRFILDEFANIGVIPDFSKKINTMHNANISFMIFVQSVKQIKTLYENDWDVIIGACDILIYLRCNDTITVDMLCRNLDVTECELTGLEEDECMVAIRGEKVFFDKKYNVFNHPNAYLLNNIHDIPIPYEQKSDYYYPTKDIDKRVKIAGIAAVGAFSTIVIFKLIHHFINRKK